MFKLIIQDDEGKTTVVPLIRDEITIGRKEGNTIRLTERNVSRRHARIVKNNGAVQIEDLNSYNGIRVNGSRISGRVAISESDRIQIGDYLLELKLDRGDQAQDPFADQKTQPIQRQELDTAPGHAAQDQTVPTAPLAATEVAGSSGNGTHVAQSGAPSAVTDDQPTTPVQAKATPPPVAAQAPPPEAVEPDTPARLVILSSNMAGREFLLSKPAMVIGRTDDNDIVVNHRSISRHHAKIVKEQGRYAIVDLQSSNGVRVNGEEYGKVELRRGDLVDLGHVRMRFVEPGEDFVFDRDATVMDIGLEPRRGKGAIMAALGLVVVIAVVLFFVLQSDDKSGDGATAAGGVTDPPVVPPTKVQPPTNPPPTPPPVEGDALKRRLKAAIEARNEERWDDMLAEAKLALKEDPNSEEAQRLAEQARRELVNEERFNEFLDLAERGRIADVVEAYRQIPEDSTYAPRATERFQEIVDDWVGKQEKMARVLADQKKCSQVDRIGSEVSRLFRDRKAPFDELSDRCKLLAQNDRPRNGGRRPKDPGDDGGGQTPPPPPPPPAGNFGELLNDARSAFAAGNYGEALRKAEKALDIEPGNQEALAFAAAAACKLRNSAKASRYVRKLKGQRAQGIKQICLESGIHFE